MSYFEELLNSRKWYISHEVFTIEADSDVNAITTEVMENLILIRADSPQEAYEKALSHGAISESDITVDDNPGRVAFKGLRELSLIYDELVDGAELEWREYELERDKIDKMLKSKDELQAFNWQPKEDQG